MYLAVVKPEWNNSLQLAVGKTGGALPACFRETGWGRCEALGLGDFNSRFTLWILLFCHTDIPYNWHSLIAAVVFINDRTIFLFVGKK